jgi:hypothetical protein
VLGSCGYEVATFTLAYRSGAPQCSTPAREDSHVDSLVLSVAT